MKKLFYVILAVLTCTLAYSAPQEGKPALEKNAIKKHRESVLPASYMVHCKHQSGVYAYYYQAEAHIAGWTSAMHSVFVDAQSVEDHFCDNEPGWCVDGFYGVITYWGEACNKGDTRL